jgi:protein sidekick
MQETKITLSDLTEDKYYEVIVVPFNSEGEGPPSLPVTVYVGEAIPTGEPQQVSVEPISSTEVQLRWKPPQANMQNGELLGYKVIFILKLLFLPYPWSNIFLRS